MAQSDSQKASILYIPHGGGPLPLLGDPAHLEMVGFLKSITQQLGQPSAIVVISAHWEERGPTITSGNTPDLIYDYYGFPDEAYQIQYPASGHPDLAHTIMSLFKQNGLRAFADRQRGFDHGLYVPLKIMYPNADIPCVQLSLVNSLAPRAHIRVGQALAGLKAENLLILGSGFSFHNMRAFIFDGQSIDDPQNAAFQKWLVHTLTRTDIAENDREEMLSNWQEAPFARYCHPREEHLLPLHVCYGIAGTTANRFFEMEILGKKATALLWSPR